MPAVESLKTRRNHILFGVAALWNLVIGASSVHIDLHFWISYGSAVTVTEPILRMYCQLFLALVFLFGIGYAIVAFGLFMREDPFFFHGSRSMLTAKAGSVPPDRRSPSAPAISMLRGILSKDPRSKGAWPRRRTRCATSGSTSRCPTGSCGRPRRRSTSCSCRYSSR